MGGIGLSSVGGSDRHAGEGSWPPSSCTKTCCRWARTRRPYRLLTERPRLHLRGGRPPLPRGRRRGAHACSPARRCATSRTCCGPGHLAQLADDPRRSGGVGERPVRRARAAEERQHRRRRRAAVVPGHRHRDRHGQEGAARVHRRRRRGGDRARRLRHLPHGEPALLAARAARHVPRRRTPAPTCRRRSRSTRPTATSTSSCSWPRAAARPTRATSSRRPRRSSTRRASLRVPRREAALARHRGVPAVSPGASSSAAPRRSTRSRSAKLASARYLDSAADRRATSSGAAFRDLELEAAGARADAASSASARSSAASTSATTSRVIRLPRHGASCPVGDRRVVLGRSPGARQDHRATACSSSSSRRDPARFLPDVDESALARRGRADRSQPADERDPRELSRYPIRTRLSLTGPMIVARDIAHAKIKERLDRGEAMPQYLQGPRGLLRRPGEDAGGLRVGLLRADHRGPHGRLRRPVPGAGRQPRDARQGQPLAGGHRRVQEARRLLPRLDRRAGGAPRARTASRRSRCSSTPSSAWRRSGASRSRTSPRSSSSTTRATTSSPGWA